MRLLRRSQLVTWTLVGLGVVVLTTLMGMAGVIGSDGVIALYAGALGAAAGRRKPWPR